MDAKFPNKSLPSGSTSPPTPKTALPQISDTPDNPFRKPADGFTPATRFPNVRLRSPWVRTPMTTAVQFTPTSPLLQKTPVSTALLPDSRPSTKSRFTPYKKSVSCSDLKTAASIESTLSALPIMPDVSRLSTDDSLNWSPKSFDTLKTCWFESSTQTAFSPKMDSETVAPIPLEETIPLEMAMKMQMLEKISTLHGKQLDKTRDRLNILVDSLLRTIGMLNSAILKGQAQEEKIKALEGTIRHNNA